MITDPKLIKLCSLLIFLILAAGPCLYFVDGLRPFLPEYIRGVGAFAGTFTGVVAGLIITYVVQYASEEKDRKQRIKNYILEIEINEEKINEWLSQITNYRNSVNGDSLHTFFYYFKLSSFLYMASDKIFYSGDLYNLLSKEELIQLQTVYSEFSAAWETTLNNDITAKRESFVELKENDDLNTWQKYFKPETINHINWIEEKFNNHLNILINVKNSLQEL